MNLTSKLAKLESAYPDHITSVSRTDVIWKDGTHLAIGELTPSPQETLDHPSLADQLMQAEYPAGQLPHEVLSTLKTDPGRTRNTLFFTKMYGDSPEKVMKHLTTILWMPDIFSNRFPLKVTTVNDVDQKLIAISSELSALPKECHPFLFDPPDTFFWRKVAGTERLSPHSFGIAIDINVEHAHYWQWDLQKAGKPISETSPLMPFQNRIPWEIVLIFEKYGFIWGGKWHHYDTMHFEYRPELLTS